MKKWLMCVLILLMMAPAVQGKDNKKSNNTSKAVQKKAENASPAQEKETPFQALIVMEASTGQVLEEVNPHLQHPLASVTKLMTAAIVMEKLESGAAQLNETITVSGAASKMGGSQVYLKEGEVFTLEDLMKAIMVASGNDAAYAVAEHLAGTTDAFVEEMNKKAKRLGMNDSEFHSVHGLPPSSENQADVSSCHDLMILARDLLKYPKLLEWTALQTEPFRGGAFIMRNHNKIIGKLPGTDGFKTGYYAKAGFNIVATAKKDGLRLIVAVLGSPMAKTRDAVAIARFKKYLAQYQMAVLSKKDQAFGEALQVPDGMVTTVQAVAAADFSYPLPREKKAAVKNEIRLPKEISGGIEQGQTLGEVEFFLDNQSIGKVNLISPATIEKAGFFKRLFR
ncbi:MAG: D-alanyl-D-alanine carboxypeptidase [Desulfobacter postgatei]|uniref:D-alanyl-D-alanine carboxypeptidase family protein n=1 Tax=Desulfobacter postgatei TaxID=2293 RepID=UPI0023F0AC99|nr:D-alanyl-D-alanine carboxypeptidase family protein [Desulfobacter postgatei]MDD4272346.1 D-alanyl-D-alanine carboxypeptidase [Desulfobacter postgatei]